jgi:hypothetical protein
METKFKIGDQLYLLESGEYDTDISLVTIQVVRFSGGRVRYFFGRTKGAGHHQLFGTWEEALNHIKN